MLEQKIYYRYFRYKLYCPKLCVIPFAVIALAEDFSSQTVATCYNIRVIFCSSSRAVPRVENK